MKSKGFQFPHCLGILDVKVMQSHLSTSKPGLYVISLFDSDHSFIQAEVTLFPINDGIFEKSELWKNVASYPNLPEDTALPYVFLSNITHPSANVLTSVHGNFEENSAEYYFNERLNYSRQIADNTLAFMSSVFGVFNKPILLGSSKHESLIMACIMLHNFLRQSPDSRDIYSPEGSFDFEELYTAFSKTGFKDVQTPQFEYEDNYFRDNFIKCMYEYDL
ncbi:unnamed protein product [Leptidea sinapis]|uniref:DDE Tnp4 domain-containing protein n=1 Tax=Leptidea sinapis TaxID=189913 RepID=A0A5E4Q0E6_9NEOP|nr:unnamed protein product [Leptidea sinapis]